jgi:hypothetical protein
MQSNTREIEPVRVCTGVGGLKLQYLTAGRGPDRITATLKPPSCGNNVVQAGADVHRDRPDLPGIGESDMPKGHLTSAGVPCAGPRF